MSGGEISVVRSPVVLGCFVLLLAGLGSAGGQANPALNAVPADALKVFKVIDMIETAGPPPGGVLRRVSIAERELNAYLDFRRRAEHWEMVTDVRLKLKDDQKVEGMFLLDLSGTKFASWLPRTATFYFGARLETAQGKARLRLDKLFLDQQAIQPAVVDLILMFASRRNSDVPSSLGEWVELPLGIRELRTSKETLTALY